MSEVESYSAQRPIGALIDELISYKTQFDVFRFMKRATEIFGARTFMVFNLPAPTSLDLSSNSIITNWPAELLSAYDQTQLLSDSPVILHLRTSTVPFQYDFDRPGGRFTYSRPFEEPRDLFCRFGLPRGAHFPVHDSSGSRGAVSFAGDRPPFSLSELIELSYLSMYVYNRLAEIRDMDNRATEMLTEREIDCLNWTAAGKTSVEIAEILGLSEHTINHYLNRATKKLDTVNRTQAVAKALRIGLIK
ncbi:autoinducer binding domain-containing protein [Ciceribacter sp. L1K23]|uniref:LuxR family transcriptional regulator n=1 Tax=unclassified Ciceribacter TaxID=2628820 RepID=UPI001ABE283B|nr:MULTISPECIES: autoinducer binding domain-containing protein [unclassified Ciceribacter]MBO3759055.1 autoinducer binding domain-containing protein [Ciceribacter sp. L1K22]MBR0556798.1 autoinducer binding domain-containing protein [Ciceribacter sp. L1K23]